MIEVLQIHSTELEDGTISARPSYQELEAPGYKQNPKRFYWLKQLLRFGLVGGLNTLLDILVLNALLLLFPTTSTTTLLAYNALAFSIGAINSFLLNKYWTFGHKQKTTLTELSRFTLTTLCGIGWSSLVLWLASTLLHPVVGNATLWANAAKLVSVASSALLSYVGMRLWVFVRPSHL